MLIVVVNPGCLLRAVATHVDSMLINNKKESGKSDRLSFKPPNPLISRMLFIGAGEADGAADGAVYTAVRSSFTSGKKNKKQPQPHPSCNGCSRTFHFVWQTLIFTSKVLSWRQLIHALHLLGCLPEGCFRRNGKNKHRHGEKFVCGCCVRPRFIKAVGYLNAN